MVFIIPMTVVYIFTYDVSRSMNGIFMKFFLHDLKDHLVHILELVSFSINIV